MVLLKYIFGAIEVIISTLSSSHLAIIRNTN